MASNLPTSFDSMTSDNSSTIGIMSDSASQKNELESAGAMSTLPYRSTHDLPPTHDLEGICQTYKGLQCIQFLLNQSVYVPAHLTQEVIEKKLTDAFLVISFSRDLSMNCEVYALPSLCYSTFPICRTPDITNAIYFHERSKSLENILNQTFANKHFDLSANESIRQQNKSTKIANGKYNVNIGYSPSRNSMPLRRICKKDCEILENELCQKEYSIAKRHPHIGQQLTLEECVDLPNDSFDCLELGIKPDVAPEDWCYWEQGERYRGTTQITMTGKVCMKWGNVTVGRFPHELPNFPELAGAHNYCRNPGGTSTRPWCYNTKMEKELCNIPQCAPRFWFYISVVMISIIAVLLLILFCYFCKKYKRNSDVDNIQNINLPNVDKNIYGNSCLNSPIEMSSLLTTANTPPGRGMVNRVSQYNLQDVRFIEELGEGAFGKVYKGELSKHDGTKLYVAVKALKEDASVKTQSDFRREIDLITDLRHDNIVCILGVVLKQEPLCMLFEYMSQGDLHEFLIANSPNEGKDITPLQFIQISMHISNGMEYLASHHYVHRDLAARNCLVGDNLSVKISDFGLSRDIYSSDYYRVQSKSLLPVRWMPPESILYGKFTTESDVWSYGVVLWELYSYGLQPYYGYSNQEVINMVRARQLLPCPDGCPTLAYSLMVECWHEQAVRRPGFAEIGHRLKLWHQTYRRDCSTVLGAGE